jgi:hypothetical protein
MLDIDMKIDEKNLEKIVSNVNREEVKFPDGQYAVFGFEGMI